MTMATNVTPRLTVHYGAAILFPAMALMVWLLIRGLSGRAATVAKVALSLAGAADLSDRRPLPALQPA